MVPMMIVAKESTTSGTKTPFTGSVIKRHACRGYTVAGVHCFNEWLNTEIMIKLTDGLEQES